MTTFDSKTVSNAGPDAISVAFEPWRMAYLLPAGQSFRVDAQSEQAGELEIATGKDWVAVYAWVGATMKVGNGFVVVDDFDGAVPPVPPGMSIKQFDDRMFGARDPEA